MNEARRCTAKNRKTGERCKKAAILGGFVCGKHGGQLPSVRNKANQRIKDMLADAIDPDNSMREAARLAYSDIRELFDAEGRMLPIKAWPEDIARAVASVEVVKGNVDAGDGKRDTVVKLRMWDKSKALENLMKHHGQLIEKVEHSGGIAIKWEGEDG